MKFRVTTEYTARKVFLVEAESLKDAKSKDLDKEGEEIDYWESGETLVEVERIDNDNMAKS